MAVRLSAEWMNLIDDRLLEFLEAHIAASPSKLSSHKKINFKRTYINRRLLLLEKAGLVQKVGGGAYSITPEGELYLAGTFDARDIDDPRDSD